MYRAESVHTLPPSKPWLKPPNRASIMRYEHIDRGWDAIKPMLGQAAHRTAGK
jgi:hypothetical protein